MSKPAVECEACDAGYRLTSDGLHYDDERGGRTWGICRKVSDMTNTPSSPTKPVAPLSDEEVAEIEARPWVYPYLHNTEQRVLLKVAERDALCQTVRALLKERDEWKEFAEECKAGIRASHRVLDGLGVPREDAWLEETDGESYGIEQVTEYPAHERIKMLPPFVATTMRTACVEKVRGRLSDPSLRFYDDGIKAAIIDWTNYMIRELESLTLDSVGQEKR